MRGFLRRPNKMTKTKHALFQRKDENVTNFLGLLLSKKLAFAPLGIFLSTFTFMLGANMGGAPSCKRNVIL